MVEDLNRDGTLTTDQKLDVLHDNLSEISDEFLRAFISSLEKDLSKGDVAGLIKGCLRFAAEPVPRTAVSWDVLPSVQQSPVA